MAYETAPVRGCKLDPLTLPCATFALHVNPWVIDAGVFIMPVSPVTVPGWRGDPAGVATIYRASFALYVNPWVIDAGAVVEPMSPVAVPGCLETQPKQPLLTETGLGG